MKDKKILWFNVIGWVFFGIALLNVFGIFKLFENTDDVAMDFGLSMILPIPDFKTIFLLE